MFNDEGIHRKDCNQISTDQLDENDKNFDSNKMNSLLSNLKKCMLNYIY